MSLSPETLNYVLSALGGAVGVVTFLEPLAIKLLDAYLLPNLESVFDRVNPQAAALVNGADGEAVVRFILEALEAENKGYKNRWAWLQSWAVKRFLARHSLKINASELGKALVSP